MTATAVHGQVQNAQGHPVAQARVAWLDGPVPLPEVMALSDAQGRFTLSAPVPGAYRLQCTSDEHGQATHALQVPAGAGGPLMAVLVKLPG